MEGSSKLVFFAEPVTETTESHTRLFDEIMIIDDQRTDRFIARRTIEISEAARSVVNCTSALQALHYLEKCLEDSGPLPELILLDINMPLFSGWDFIEELRMRIAPRTELPIMFILSSSENIIDINKARSYKEIAGFIHKPLTMDCLHKILKRSLGAS